MAGLRVGLTGGIASGKSTVSAHLRELGAAVIDYDLLAREAVEPGTATLEAIAERFGHDLILPDGSLDRPALGAIVFADDSARRDLESITHPAITGLAREREAAVSSEPVVVHDHPLLVETNHHERMDVVIVVDVDPEVQVERMVQLRNMSEADARARLGAQASRAERRAAADIVIENSGDLEHLRSSVEEVWQTLLRRAGID